MELGLSLKQAQTLSPQMMQAMEILQMGSQELLEYIQETLQENPVLESEERRQPQESPEDALLRRKLEWLESTDVQNRWYHQEDAQDLSDLTVGAVGADPGEESLYYYLRSQIQFETLPKPLAAAVQCVLESLSGNGYLDDPVADLATHAGVDEKTMERAVELVQALEPAGVGARNLSECLCLQLTRRGETGLPLTIADRYLEAMSKDHYNLIARETGASREDIQAACKVIRYLQLTEGYITKMYLDSDNQVCGYEFVHMGKFMDAIKKGVPADEALKSVTGTYGRTKPEQGAVKSIDPRKE